VLLSAAALVACVASPPSLTAPAAYATAVAACMHGLGEGWRVAVEIDRADSSTLALVSGDSVASCQTWKNTERTNFALTTTAVGLHPPGSPRSLSYLTGGGTGNKTSFLAGRFPPSASAVRIGFADGSEHDAVLGGALWLAWLEQPADAEPTTIDALDASGTVISRLADVDGIQPSG
jgi:hypothetical protein